MTKGTENIKKEIQAIVDIYKSGDLSKAELLTKKLIKNYPNSAFLYNLLGLILASREKIDEAIESGCNLVIAHHPIIFSGLKKINGKKLLILI